jgi:hypothetical protein
MLDIGGSLFFSFCFLKKKSNTSKSEEKEKYKP